MKQILLIFTVITLISCQKERDTCLIIGNIIGIPDSTVIDLYVQHNNSGQRINSDTIINGYFEFSDTLKVRPSKMSLMIRDWDSYFGSCDFWADYEVIEITGSGKYLSDGKGTFSNISADYGIKGLPTYILIDPHGVIIEKWVGYWTNVFNQKLEKHIEGLRI